MLCQSYQQKDCQFSLNDVFECYEENVQSDGIFKSNPTVTINNLEKLSQDHIINHIESESISSLKLPASQNTIHNTPSDTTKNDTSFKRDFYSKSYFSVLHDEDKESTLANEYRKAQKITMYGEGKSQGLFHPIRDFTKLGFEKNLLEAVRNFKEPTPIQASSWPVIASGRDTIGIAQTGSGKTLAFSIPAFAHIRHRLDKEQASSFWKPKKYVKRKGPIMLVVAPTRELAQQSQDVIEAAGKACGIRSVSVYGGVSKDLQRRSLNKNGGVPFEVVIATPGRLIDLMQEQSCDLSEVSYLVLDEADRMLDQGFEKDVRKIIAATHADRQTCLFSATWPDSVRELAHEFLQNPIKITIGSDDLTAASTIEQIVEVFDDERQRQGKLLDILKKHQKSGPSTDKQTKMKRVLIFVLYKKEATRIEEFLQAKGWNATSIQGDKTQAARQKAVDDFKAGTIPLLVATDVAARGLDIPGVDLVINFSFPLTIEDYVHRIGRTGRAGKKGIAHTFFQTRADKLRAGELVKVLRDAGQNVPEKMLSFDLSIRKKGHKLYGAFGPKEHSSIPMKAPSKIVFGDND